MADEREAAASENKTKTGARSGPERYPSVSPTDAVESPGRHSPGEMRSFDPSMDAPTQRPAPGDPPPVSTNEGRLGPGGDPAEGKR